MALEGLLNTTMTDSEEVNIFQMNSAEVNIENGDETSQAKVQRDEIAHDIQTKNPSFHLFKCGLAETLFPIRFKTTDDTCITPILNVHR